ncbi:unnamed protein product [Clonostachys rosea]|uniref:NACHT domain-containing protein n=1 Tax=Bionectria ochroleuca TaxID=29856 RepID=A0ABY6UUG4_BIOOC|nr:unnamed protein product [Clonostachys rosea]
MRLLQLQNGVLRLTKNLDNVPPYAILSHTWGSDQQEVTFQDVMQEKGKDKEGYRKVEFCGNQAALDGLHYFWVDTCCIDKSSSTELQESLNSMFRWYQNAAKCYVYLADVPNKAEVDELSRADWKLNLRTSRWFRRGWTLQELVAPSIVEFFSCNGEKLGDKASLESLLSEITKLPAIALRGCQLSTFSVDERMSWIQGRQTKKEEDMAYSLFGIFGVQIPLLYGEGREKAFGRLRQEIDHHDYQARVASKLPVAHGAAFDSHAEEHNSTCLEGTRVELLSQISKWADNPQTEALFWLNGMAGTGKSTISRTIASDYNRGGRLGASFFFKKGEADRGSVSKFFTTIAAQLALSIPATARYIHSAISSDSAILGKAMRLQFEELILQPLADSRGAIRQTPSYLIVVDALDECEVENDIKLLINLFSAVREKAPGLKVFITSRPELPIRLGFKATNGAYDKVVLHEIADSVIEHDITVFLTHELERIRYNYNESVPEERQLDDTWPTQQDSQDLVKMAVPLFISAATVCLFIADRVGGNPRKKLDKILNYRTRSQESKLDAMYLIVLEQLLAGLSGEDLQETLAQFRRVVGSIVALVSPLSSSALARLLNLPLEDVSDLLDLLHSVLSVPSSSKQPIRLLHLSFRDFLLDPQQSEKNIFWIDRNKTHGQLATNCICTLKKTLRVDICGLVHPGATLSSINSEKISAILADEVQYACRYWGYHLNESGTEILDGGQVHTFLSGHFLQWLEALSLMGRATESVNTIRIVRSLIPANSSSNIARLLDDAIRFIRAFVAVIQSCPLQVYSSALVFAPRNSIIRSLFDHQMPSWISLQPDIPTNWNSNIQTLEGHRGSVSSVVFSPDSKLVASGSSDTTIQLWAADSGALLRTLEAYCDKIESVAFSSDGRTLASVSSHTPWNIRMWDVNTGALLQTQDIQVNGEFICCATLSPDMKLFAIGSLDGLIQISATQTGALQRTLQGRIGTFMEPYQPVLVPFAFSSDSKFVAASSADRKIQIWRTDTGKLLQVMTFPTDDLISSVSFSPNSELVATGSRDYFVRIWDVKTGALLQKVEHNAMIRSVAFSPDSKLLASALDDGTIELWAADTGLVQQLLECHSGGVFSVTFSPDGKLVASGLEDGTVRLWVVNNREAPVQTRHDDSINSLSLSPDERTVALASNDRTVQLWDTKSGMLQRTLHGHSASVLQVLFSPDGKIVASCSEDGTVRLWAADTGALRHTCEHHIELTFDSLKRIVFSPDSKLVASASTYNILLWAADTGCLLCRSRDHSRDIGFLAFSPDSKLLASASERTIQLYSPDSELLASASKRNIQLYSITTGSAFWADADEPCSLPMHPTLESFDNDVPLPVFSSDKGLTASASDIPVVRTWAAGSAGMKLQQTLEAHTGQVCQVAFSPDSRCIASALDDNSVRIWETGTGILHRVIDIGILSETLRFLTTNELQTDAGIISIDKPNMGPRSAINPKPGCGLSPDRSWITLDGRNLIWLPPEFRTKASWAQVVFDSTVVIGCSSGNLIIMRFSVEQFR